ncbi:hypothetical protein B296_00048105 [Ensete ventricosum]|uniref:Uncharacterized protein n=1 Tax=Ensete ventricosum TaxID=4639 RepID=A0A426XS88_ENSVE|nr:hypothetical protein B296_00048105 [Ensete ventricosum]
MDDELLQIVKDLEIARAELPRQSVAQYKESLGFKEGLKWMGRVTYEYGYRVALARFRARHLDADVEEDPFLTSFRCQSIGCRSRARLVPDCWSDFEIGLALGSGKLGGLRRPEAMAPLRRAGFPGSGPLVTPFAGVPPGEPIGPCASSPAVFSVRSWSSAGWMVIQSSAREVGCWNGGARVGRKYSSSGRSLIPARMSSRVGSRRDPSDGQVSLVVGFAIPLPRRGARAYIVGSTTLAVLAVRDASTGEGIGLICVRSVVRPLGYRPYLCQVGRTTTGAPIPASDQLPVLGRSRRRASCPKER